MAEAELGRRVGFLRVLRETRKVLEENEKFSSIDEIGEKVAARIAEPGAVDWENLLKLIMEMLPLILQILAFF